MAAFPDLGLDTAGRFAAVLGLEFDETRADRVTGRLRIDHRHRNAWGDVHGGVYSTAVERAASVGASRAVADRGLFAVGVHNATDVFVHSAEGPAEVIAEPVFQSEDQQVWSVSVTAAGDGTLLAHGRLRLQNIPRRDAPA
ncbi:PaaI family thioesterase [Streptomyces sp. NPDC014894]|uniref:PaaI family thioesterase n=1 Tax=unclassified Streptomyces TaxID=2593676 RepID=UPI0036FA4128